MAALAVRAILLAGGRTRCSSGDVHAAAFALWRWARCMHAARAKAAAALSAFVHADHGVMRRALRGWSTAGGVAAGAGTKGAEDAAAGHGTPRSVVRSQSVAAAVMLLSPKAVAAAAAADARAARRAISVYFRRWHELASAQSRERLATRARRRRLASSAFITLRSYAQHRFRHRRREGAVVAVVSLLEMNLVICHAFRRWRAGAEYSHRLVAWVGFHTHPASQLYLRL
jgi:hypothetical protein